MDNILLQLDGDDYASSFDRIVAYDAGADQVISYPGVEEPDVESLVHGAIFTRGPEDLHRTAIFVGGSDVSHAEELFGQVRTAFHGPFRVSVMLDPNGTNTTAAAALVKVMRATGDVAGKKAVVLAGTGAVGSRVCGILAESGAEVVLTGRNRSRAETEAEKIREKYGGTVTGKPAPSPAELGALLEGAELLFATGPEGVRLVEESAWSGVSSVEAVADVNAVPPLGIEGVDRDDDGVTRHDALCFGAIGIGNFKMKLHRAAVRRLFEDNEAALEAEAIYRLAKNL